MLTISPLSKLGTFQEPESMPDLIEVAAEVLDDSPMILEFLVLSI